MKIVCGVDLSTGAMAAVRRAVELADLAGGELHLVHAAFVPAGLLAALSYTMADFDAATDAQTEIVWSKARGLVGDRDVIWVGRRGYPPDVLADYAAEVEADLVVVGARGRGEVASLLLGSTSQRVLHLAHCDVLVVKEGEEDK